MASDETPVTHDHSNQHSLVDFHIIFFNFICLEQLQSVHERLLQAIPVVRIPTHSVCDYASPPSTMTPSPQAGMDSVREYCPQLQGALTSDTSLLQSFDRQESSQNTRLVRPKQNTQHHQDPQVTSYQLSPEATLLALSVSLLSKSALNEGIGTNQPSVRSKEI